MTTQPASVAVTNPSHYAGTAFIEAIDSFRSVPANLGNAYRYISRLGLKGGDNTEARDAKAAAWYAFDLMAFLLLQDDGDYNPTKAALADFDLHNFSNIVDVYRGIIINDTGLDFAGDPLKAKVLAMIRMEIEHCNKSMFVGMAERHYKEFVIEVLAVCAAIIKFAEPFVDVADIGTIYKGAKSFEVDRATKNRIAILRGEFRLKAANDGQF